MSKKQKPAPIIVKKNEQNPQPDSIIAQAIIDLSESTKWANNGKLKRRAVLLLLNDMSGVAMTNIDKILNALPALKDQYVAKE